MLSTPQQGVRWALLSLSQRPRLLATWSRNALVSTTSKKGGGGPGRRASGARQQVATTGEWVQKTPHGTQAVKRAGSRHLPRSLVPKPQLH